MEKALIKVIGMAVGASDDEMIEMQTIGTIYEKGNKTYINYVDSSLDEGHGTNTYVKIGDNKVNVTRHGATTTQLTYEVDKTHYASYETGFGILEIETTTKEIVINHEGNQLEVKVRYDMSMNKGEAIDSIFKVSAIIQQ